MRHIEDNIQMDCVRWFRLQYPEIIIHHSPNGGKRNAREAGRFKAMGTLPGFPDLFIATARNGHHGLFIEMKAGNNKPTAEQTAVMLDLFAEGYKCALCYSVDDFMSAVREYLR